ncbi:MAG: alginate lyase family protein [Erysipelotrichaceae bacterium]
MDKRWIYNRLKTMNLFEITWRIQQKALYKREYNLYYLSKKSKVINVKLTKKLCELQPNVKTIGLNLENINFTKFEKLDLFDLYDYDNFKDKWNAGFQTENVWDEERFSNYINCSQKINIGDIRTNWELNRHFQFSCLAKTYYVTGNIMYFNEFRNLFMDWNEHNLFLHGVEWKSAMEVAIRVNSWIFSYAFLFEAMKKYNNEYSDLLELISNGIKVMVNYIIKHRARFSSTNNHLIVEMYAVCLAGVFFEYKPWIKYSSKILTKELKKQNHIDGVNKEMSLHYQSFIMEAYGLLMLIFNKNNIHIPNDWPIYLNNMSEFVCDCCGNFGETIVFGDNDEGKILDLSGVKFDHYRYVLDLMGLVLSKRYSELNSLHENLYWLFTSHEIDKSRKKEKYLSSLSNCYKKGGYTIIRSKDRKVLIGIDHADLGLGKLAAHGHADALSFQLFVKGIPVFVDSGTFNYHIYPEDRDCFRKTDNHNTVSIDGKDQSEMLGPFMWGKKAKCSLLEYKNDPDQVKISAKVEYGDIEHIRTLTYDFESLVNIKDMVKSSKRYTLTFLVNPEIEINVREGCTNLSLNKKCKVQLYNSSRTQDMVSYNYSSMYNKKVIGHAIKYIINEESCITRIQIG